jgi:hypothetical protein
MVFINSVREFHKKLKIFDCLPRGDLIMPKVKIQFIVPPVMVGHI